MLIRRGDTPIPGVSITNMSGLSLARGLINYPDYMHGLRPSRRLVTLILPLLLK